jgi:hypothetical protein
MDSPDQVGAFAAGYFFIRNDLFIGVSAAPTSRR